MCSLFFLPVGVPRFDNALKEGLELTKWYAQEHVLLCLVPALFIAGGISVFVNQASVMRYLGPKANKALAYGVASVSGTILAVCSCTVLPLFGGIWMRGAGLGPATAFLYSGPAINVLAIVMTARVLGMNWARRGPLARWCSAWSSGWRCTSSSGARNRPRRKPQRRCPKSR